MDKMTASQKMAVQLVEVSRSRQRLRYLGEVFAEDAKENQEYMLDPQFKKHLRAVYKAKFESLPDEPELVDKPDVEAD